MIQVLWVLNIIVLIAIVSVCYFFVKDKRIALLAGNLAALAGAYATYVAFF